MQARYASNRDQIHSTLALDQIGPRRHRLGLAADDCGDTGAMDAWQAPGAFARKQFLRGVAVLLLASFVVACTTTRTIDVGTPSAFAEEVHPGDRVAITTRDGQELAFEVVRVEEDALVGATERVQRDEIAKLEVTRLSPARTAGLAAGVAGGGVLLAVMVAGFVFLAVAPAMILGATP